MEWELVNGITGVVSAVCAVLGLSIQRSAPSEPSDNDRHRLLSHRRLASFMLTSSGWALCCLCFLLVVEPYGPFVTHREYVQFYGVVLCVPALLILRYGVSLADRREEAKRRHGDTETR